MAEFKTISNLNCLPIEVPQNVENFINVLELSTEPIDSVDAYQYEEDEPKTIYTDFAIEVQDYGKYLVEVVLDIDNKNPGYSYVQLIITGVTGENTQNFDPVIYIGSNLETNCNSLSDAKRFLHKLFKEVRREVITLQEEFAEN